MLIRYNSHRPEYKDALYDTGMWTSGQVKEVPDAVAHKMTKHADVYSEVHSGAEREESKGVIVVESAGLVVVEEKGNPPEDDPDQNAVDAVQTMNSKDALADYAKINFGQTVPKTMTVENMKQRIITMIGQYGAQ